MNGTALDHPLVRDYLRGLDAAMRGLPAAQARELREQITAHLDDALPPDASDQEVATTLRRLGAPADLAAEARAAGGPAPGTRRGRWRLAAIIAVPTVLAAVLGTLPISGDVRAYAAAGRDQQLARLGTAVITLTQDLENERDLSGGYAADPKAGPLPATLASARVATNAAASAVLAGSAGVGPGYQPATVQDLHALLSALNDLKPIRAAVSSGRLLAYKAIEVYTINVIDVADEFSAAAGTGVSDPRLQDTDTNLGALLQVGNAESLQRGILYAALSAKPPALSPLELAGLQQAAAQQDADLNNFDVSADLAEQQLFVSTVAGATVDRAALEETTAEAQPLTRLTATTWYGDMSTTIADTRQVTAQLDAQATARASALRSDAARNLLLSSIATFLVLSLLILVALASMRRRRRG